jgi:hypothetical protein
MRNVVCDGCNRTEEAGLPDKQQKVRHVVIVVQDDTREFAENKQEHTADLCHNCREFILTKFFRVEGQLKGSAAFDHELPEFMNHPTEMEKELTLAQ